MILGLFTLLIAIAISAVSAYYSILGLVAIFAAAALPVMIMGASLELGKVTTAVWLHKNWRRSSWTYKVYLIPALLLLMILTSMGTFGFLSKAHVDQGVPTGNVQAQIELLDTKIATQRDNISAARKNLAQLDAAVDETLKRSTTEGGASRSAQLRRNQAKDRATIQNETEAAQKQIAKLQEERATIATELRKVEAEVGPIKYVAAMIYGDNPDANLLEKAVRWVIIMIVIVFDPLAIVLILAGSKQMEWAWADRRERKLLKQQKISSEIPQPDTSELDSKIAELTKVKDSLFKAYEDESADNMALHDKIDQLEQQITKIQSERDKLFTAHSYEMTRADTLAVKLSESLSHKRKSIAELLAETPENVIATEEFLEPEIVKDVVVEPVSEPIVESIIEIPVDIKTDGVTTETVMYHPSEGYVTFEGKLMSIDALKTLRPDLVLSNNNPSTQIMFGAKFPQYAKIGDIYIRTDAIPHIVFKFNGQKWIGIDKQLNHSYLHYIPYIQYLIQKIESGEYDAELLTDDERDEIATHLQSK